MADPADQVTLKLTFWHKGKVPGDLVEVRRDEVPSWHGFAVPVEDDETPEPAKTEDSSPAAAKAPAKTSTAK